MLVMLLQATQPVEFSGFKIFTLLVPLYHILDLLLHGLTASKTRIITRPARPYPVCTLPVRSGAAPPTARPSSAFAAGGRGVMMSWR